MHRSSRGSLPAAAGAGAGATILRATLRLVVVLLDLVLELAASDGTADHAEQRVAKVLATCIAGSGAANGAHQAALAFLLVVGISCAELIALSALSGLLLLAVTTVVLAATGKCQLARSIVGERPVTHYCWPLWLWS